MNYKGGEKVIIGDIVKLGESMGVVVCSIDREEYSDNFPKEKWSYLGSGVLVEFENLGLIHYEQPETQLELVSREKD